MIHNIWIYIALTILTTNAIRVIPMVLIRKQITNTFLRSFLYYVPYVTLAVMTFPAIMMVQDSASTGSAIDYLPGLAALVLGVVAAWRGWGLFPVSILCCVVAYMCQLFTAF